MADLDTENMEKQLGFPCDLKAARNLLILREVPADQRDQKWAETVLETLPTAFLVALNANPILGPDGLPYFSAALPPDKFDAGDKIAPISVTGFMKDCLDMGVGVVVFNDASQSSEPFWVLSYGNILSLYLYGSLSGDPADLEEMKNNPQKVIEGSNEEIIQKERETLLGAPSEEYLPSPVRKMLGEIYEKVYQFEDVGIALMVDPAYAPSRHIVLSLRREDFKGDEEKLQNLILLTQWYIPPNRPIILNFGLEKKDFASLKG